MRYTARVMPGKGRGKRIGFPTLNLEIPDPSPYSHGIYAGWITVAGHAYAAAFHFGPIPTFHEATPTLEAYVLDASFARAPASVEFEFVQRLRDIRTFQSAAALAAQIADDAAETRAILQQSENTEPHVPAE